MTDLEAAKSTLLAELREHSLVIGEVTLSSGQVAQYYVDARRTLMRPGGFRAAGELIAAAGLEVGGTGGGAGGAGGRGGGGRGAGAGGDRAVLRCAGGAGGGRPGRLLRPRREEAARAAALGRGAGRGRGQMPGRRGHGDHRRLDRGSDRTLPRGGPGDRRR